MRFTNITACLGSLFMATVSASTPASFELPGSAPGTAAAPQVDTTTVYSTSTYYVTSAITKTSAPVASSPASSVVAPVMSSSCTANVTAPTDPLITPSVSLFVTDGKTFVPVTVWGPNSTYVVFPQNSTAVAAPTGNITSTVVITTSASKTAASTSKASASASTTASASATVSEVPINGAGKVAGNALLGLGAVAGFMALL